MTYNVFGGTLNLTQPTRQEIVGLKMSNFAVWSTASDLLCSNKVWFYKVSCNLNWVQQVVLHSTVCMCRAWGNIYW